MNNEYIYPTWKSWVYLVFEIILWLVSGFYFAVIWPEYMTRLNDYELCSSVSHLQRIIIIATVLFWFGSAVRVRSGVRHLRYKQVPLKGALVLYKQKVHYGYKVYLQVVGDFSLAVVAFVLPIWCFIYVEGWVLWGIGTPSSCP